MLFRSIQPDFSGIVNQFTSTTMIAFKPVSSIMASHLVTVNPEDTLDKVREIFNTHKFHHLPVVRFREIIGIISRNDFDHFIGGVTTNIGDQIILENRLKRTAAQDIMTKGLGKVEPDDRINVALEIFCINRFHALPVVQDGELVGIITPFDIMRALLDEKPSAPHLAYDNQ